MSNPIHILLLTLFAFSVPALGDHLEPNQISQTKPERRIGDLALDQTTVSQVRARYGTPINVKVDSDDGGKSGERAYYWQLPGCKLSIVTFFKPGQESSVTSIEVWGSSPSLKCSTGQGLVLGASISDLRRKYIRFQSGRKDDNHVFYALVEWRDGTQADIDFDASDKVNHIQIRTSVE